MKTAAVLVSLLALGLTTGHAEDLEYKPGSAAWADLYSPAFTSPEEIPKAQPLRGQLFDQLRSRLQPEIGHPILFSGSLKSYRNWAFFAGETVDGSGNAVGYPVSGNSDTVGLWLRTAEGWMLVDYSGGHSDVFYLVWPEKYGVPAALLGFD